MDTAVSNAQQLSVSQTIQIHKVLSLVLFE